LQLHRPGALGLDVAAPRGHALVPVVGRLLVGLLDQQQRRVRARKRAPLAVDVLEHRALVELDRAAADAQRVPPPVFALGLQRHLAGAVQAHVTGLVVGGERLDRESGCAGEQQQRGGGQKWLVHAEGLHHWIPWYSINRRSMPSRPFSRCSMRTGVGTPSTTQKMVSSLPPLTRETRMAL